MGESEETMEYDELESKQLSQSESKQLSQSIIDADQNKNRLVGLMAVVGFFSIMVHAFRLLRSKCLNREEYIEVQFAQK